MVEILKINNADYILPNGNMLWNIPNLTIDKNDKIGLIGRNGSGKSLLLSCITGDEELTTGKIIKTEDIFLIPQQKNKLHNDITLKDLLNKYTVSSVIFLNTIKQFIDIKNILHKKINTFSGGEYIKIFISIASILDRKLLLIDEPTNHLDYQGIGFLEKWLATYRGAFICVSHDINFLDAITKKTWSLEDKTIKVYGGNYSFYKKNKELEKDSLLRQVSSKKKEIQKINNAIQKQKNKDVKNRKESNKNKKDKSLSKFEIGFYKENSEKSGGKNTNKLSLKLEQVEKELIELGTERRSRVNLKIRNDTSKGKIIDIRDGVLKVADRTLISNINFEISTGERVRILGLNGVGKSLFLKTIISRDLRERNLTYSKFYFPEKFKTVYLDQFYDILDQEKTVLENVFNFSPNLSLEDTRKHLSSISLRDDALINRKVKNLSGGECVRVSIAMITGSSVDLLILDEPTNNLDIETIDELTNTLKDFEGAVILITHNEDFANSIDIQKNFIIQDGQIKLYTLEAE